MLQKVTQKVYKYAGKVVIYIGYEIKSWNYQLIILRYRYLKNQIVLKTKNYLYMYYIMRIFQDS